jgi:hypothetical protein
MGIAGVFGPGTPMGEAVRFVRENVKPREHRSHSEVEEA